MANSKTWCAALFEARIREYVILGQAIPRGLHVRLNLQTGEREAKLLDANEDTTQDDAKVKLTMDERQLKNIRSSSDSAAAGDEVCWLFQKYPPQFERFSLVRGTL